MPRPVKHRRICAHPRCNSFKPCQRSGNPLIMTLDEYEVIRLIDYAGFTQEDCAKQMNVARTTIQAIYANARKILASCIVESRPLKIEGGNVEVCGKDCGKKGDNIMRIAVAYEDGKVFQHFGHTEQFKLYDVEDGKVQVMTTVNTNGSGHGALADILKKCSVDVLICGGIGDGAKRALAEAGIELYGGVTADADQAVADFLAGNLSFNPDVACSHHDENHHGEGHSCGGHGHHGEGHSCSNH
ncbi:MAG TPA: DUF134 domain-containing protein [Candidatus Dorea intestinavium]|nr:DUF134 domain-containing protein [Candidatus Dorea intestinavium]